MAHEVRGGAHEVRGGANTMLPYSQVLVLVNTSGGRSLAVLP